MKRTTVPHLNEIGIALCSYYEEGWGRSVRYGREHNHYPDDLVIAAVASLRNHWKTLDKLPEVVIPVPSLRRPELVPDFAQRLAKMLNLPYLPAVDHIVQHPAQAQMRNSYQQTFNVLNKYEVGIKLNGAAVLLVDDIADSRWTLTIIGELLQRSGSGRVFPFVLAATNAGN
jgi:ATP-dependent DNA helicase RecQ